METKSLTVLINESTKLMRDVGYSEKSIQRFMQIWNSKLKPFLSFPRKVLSITTAQSERIFLPPCRKKQY